MPERNDKLLKEEVRGLFVLGIIGSLLALGRMLDVKIFDDVSLATLTSGLIGYWLVYVFLMAMGISDDIIRPGIARFCTGVARIFFLAGLAILMIVPILFGVFYLLRPIGVYALLAIPIVIVVVVLFVLGLRGKGSLFS
jgi:hypothetical protein